MNYIHNPYSFSGHAPVPLDQPIGFDPTMVHPSMVHPIDGYIYPHPPYEMVDFYPQPIMDYEEYAENLSRPRLTKEQVETLEAQFQAHPKPSSNVKRQLAAQTNLSLPRVANWFQNRRAKAKQQKRQEEFERMQKAKAEAEEAARSKTGYIDDSESNQDLDAPAEETDKTSTPRPSTSVTISADRHKTPAQTSSSRSKHKKTRSESAREATFASLQRALSAAVQARENGHPVNPEDASVSPTNTSYQAHNRSDGYNDSNSGQNTLNTPYTEWESARTSSVSWASSQSPQEPFGYSGLNASSFSSSQGLDSSHQSAGQSDVQYSPRGTEWPSQVQSTDSLHDHRSASADDSYNSMQYTLQSDVPLSRKGSSDELADTLEGIGIDTTGQLAHRGDGASWKEAGKELDLAARRKRPRPAAIGTSRSSSMLNSSSNMAGHSVRQSKSAQSLNSRYAGVRKASAAQRSPLNFSTFAEAGALGSTKAELSTMLQPTVSTSLAPPTPLTPEDLHHLLPTSPSDGYCLSAQPTSQFFPTTQPMQINIASPPATPLAVDMMSSYQYQNVPPMSAPAHYTSFPEYTSCDTAPLTARSWAEAPSIPSPDASFPSQHTSQQTSLYDQTTEGQAVESGSIAGSPSIVYSAKDGDLSSSVDSKPTEFLIHEFPEQQEAHRFVAQQLSSQKPKHYTFVDQSMK